MDTTKQTSFTIYKTTCLLNGKIYIGKHKTKVPQDSYLGSGKMLQHAIKKHGIENFRKEILYIFDNEEDMNAKEAELITEEFCSLDTNYNLCPGGKGGWGYINKENLAGKSFKNPEVCHRANQNALESQKALLKDQFWLAKRSKLASESLCGRKSSFLGKQHSKETKIRMAISQQRKHEGSNNSQFGSMWITDGVQNKKIKSVDQIPEGWYKGRKQKSK